MDPVPLQPSLDPLVPKPPDFLDRDAPGLDFAAQGLVGSRLYIEKRIRSDDFDPMGKAARDLDMQQVLVL